MFVCDKRIRGTPNPLQKQNKLHFMIINLTIINLTIINLTIIIS